MTKTEHTFKRDLFFSNWIRNRLPDSSTGFLVTDLDFILINTETKKIMLLEIKAKNYEVRNWQRGIFELLNRWIIKGIDSDYEYLGFHAIRFENTDFDDGLVYFDNKLVTEEDLARVLSF